MGKNGMRLMEHSVFCNCILCKHFAHFKHRLQLFYSLIVSSKTSLRNCPLCCLLFITPKNAALCLTKADNPFTYFPQIRFHLGENLTTEVTWATSVVKTRLAVSLCLSSEISKSYYFGVSSTHRRKIVFVCNIRYCYNCYAFCYNVENTFLGRLDKNNERNPAANAIRNPIHDKQVIYFGFL